MFVLVFFTGCLTGSTLAATTPMGFYATKYDHIDVEAILNNRRMVNYYAACLLSKGPCPPDGLEFKRVLPDALKTNCVKCTEKQKTVTLRTIKRLKKEYPKVWAQLQEKWDPEDKYVSLFEATYGDRWVDTNLKPTIELGNRFGESDDDTTTPSKKTTTAPTTSTSTTVTKTTKKVIVSSVTSPSPSFTNKVETTKKKIPTKTTKTPITTSKITTTIKPAITTRFPPITLQPVPNIGASIQATVSLGTNIVGDIFRGIGALGTRVAETGAGIAKAVVKNFARPLS